MRNPLRTLLIIAFALTSMLCHTQTSTTVSDPRLELRDNIVHISYDIENSLPQDTFVVEVEIRDEDGQIIEANAFIGDIGQKVKGGVNKHIAWDLEADSVFIDGQLYITVYAEAIPPPLLVIAVAEETVLNEPDSMVVENSKETVHKEQEEPIEDVKDPEIETDDTTQKSFERDSPQKSFSRTGIILQSLALPGLGLSRISGKPHWLRGVAGYGSIVTSVALNRIAIATYEDYENASPGADKEALYKKAVNQDNTSEIFAYVAIGVWVTDLIWTLIGTKDLSGNKYYGQTSGMTFGTNIDHISQIPLVALRYRF